MIETFSWVTGHELHVLQLQRFVVDGVQYVQYCMYSTVHHQPQNVTPVYCGNLSEITGFYILFM